MSSPVLRAARVLAWVAAAVVAAGELFQISADSGEFLGDLLPAWYLPVYYTGQVVCLAALVAVAWLLVVRSAGDFFDANAPSSPADEARIWDISKVRGRSTSGR